MIRIFHDSLFAGHLGVFRTVYRLQNRFIGRGFVRMFVLTWHHVLFVWPGSIRAHEELPWDMSMWDTDGIGWPWTYWTCLLPLRKAIGTFW